MLGGGGARGGGGGGAGAGGGGRLRCFQKYCHPGNGPNCFWG